MKAKRDKKLQNSYIIILLLHGIYKYAYNISVSFSLFVLLMAIFFAAAIAAHVQWFLEASDFNWLSANFVVVACALIWLWARMIKKKYVWTVFFYIIMICVAFNFIWKKSMKCYWIWFRSIIAHCDGILIVNILRSESSFVNAQSRYHLSTPTQIYICMYMVEHKESHFISRTIASVSQLHTHTTETKMPVHFRCLIKLINQWCLLLLSSCWTKSQVLNTTLGYSILHTYNVIEFSNQKPGSSIANDYH